MRLAYSSSRFCASFSGRTCRARLEGPAADADADRAALLPPAHGRFSQVGSRPCGEIREAWLPCLSLLKLPSLTLKTGRSAKGHSHGASSSPYVQSPPTQRNGAPLASKERSLPEVPDLGSPCRGWDRQRVANPSRSPTSACRSGDRGPDTAPPMAPTTAPGGPATEPTSAPASAPLTRSCVVEHADKKSAARPIPSHPWHRSIPNLRESRACCRPECIAWFVARSRAAPALRAPSALRGCHGFRTAMPRLGRLTQRIDSLRRRSSPAPS